MSIVIVTLNVNGMSDNSKRNATYHWCRKKKIDVVCLQETHSTEKVELKWKREWGTNSIWNHGLSNSRGVAIFFQKNLIMIYRISLGITPDGRYLAKLTFQVNIV